MVVGTYSLKVFWIQNPLPSGLGVQIPSLVPHSNEYFIKISVKQLFCIYLLSYFFILSNPIKDKIILEWVTCIKLF